MSTTRLQKKWADVEEDDHDDIPFTAEFRGQADSDGLITVYTYETKDGKNYRVTKRIREKMVLKKTNKAITDRKLTLKPFGAEDPERASEAIAGTGPSLDSEHTIELNPSLRLQRIGDDEKFWEESIGISEGLMAVSKSKKWDASAVRLNKIEEETVTQKTDAQAATEAANAQMINEAEKKGTYVPPSMRNKTRMDQDRAKEETTLRVTNLSEDVRDGDLQNLFGHYGQLSRVYLARFRDGEKEGQSKGFAFVTFKERKEAENARKALHGHGYDNLILQVNWAKPKA